MTKQNSDFIAFAKSGVCARLNVFKGKHKTLEEVPYSIDPITGTIELPSSCYYQKDGLQTRGDLNRYESDLVTSMWLIVEWKLDSGTLVLQRQGGDEYASPSQNICDGNDCQATFSPTLIQTRIRSAEEIKITGLPRVAVWCQSGLKEGKGNNRADVWRVFFDKPTQAWVVEHIRILVVTLDDGASFQVVEETGWRGEVLLRDVALRRYSLTKEPEPSNPKDKFLSLQNVLKNQDAHDIMRQYVFVPDAGFENFEQRLQVLYVPEFRKLIRDATPEVRKNKEGHRFWTKPTADVGLRQNQGIVDWYVYGLNDGAGGYAELEEPIDHNGEMVKKVQLRHRFIDDANTDRQGLKLVRPGDIVQIEHLIDAGKGYPPIAKCRLLYERTPQ